MLSLVLIPLMVMGAQQPQPDLIQKSSGWCSPNIAKVIGNVPVNCVGVDPRALIRLNAELSRRNLQLADTIREADEWTKRYKELEERLNEAGNDSALAAQAEEYLHRGELEKAGSVLDQILGKEEKEVNLIAANHFNRALVFELQFRFEEALPHLAKAYQYRPDDWKYSLQYSFVLLRQNDFSHAEPVLLASIETIRRLAKANKAAYQPDMAQTLNILALLYIDTRRMKEAEAANQESLDIYRELAKTNPAAYQPGVAQALNDLAILYIYTQRMKEAEAADKEALEIRRQLAKANPAAYEPHLAQSLNNLANLYSETQRMKEAEELHQEALKIRRRLAKTNPAAYQPGVANTLANLAGLYRVTGRMKEAEAAGQEVVDIRRELAKTNPAAYQPALAKALNQQAMMEMEVNHDLAQARVDVEEGLEIQRALWKTTPGIVGDDLARGLLVDIQVLARSRQPRSTLCPLAREAGSVAYDPELKELATNEQMKFCSEH